jgi:hypothetical protein
MEPPDISDIGLPGNDMGFKAQGDLNDEADGWAFLNTHGWGLIAQTAAGQSAGTQIHGCTNAIARL